MISCIDIGANLTNKRFRHDLPQVLKDAHAAGVVQMILTGTTAANSAESADLAAQYPGVLYSTAGIHPHDASDFDLVNTGASLNDLYQCAEVVAVGECGLDYNRDFSPRDVQRACFAAHLDLAVQTGLPMFLHERDAFEDFSTMLAERRTELSAVVVHCFTGTASQADSYLALDCHLGITGWICDERRGRHLREVVKNIPADRLMIETDCPYLAPRDIRPKVNRNEPKYLPHILQTVAKCRGESAEVLADSLLITTRQFFRIGEPSAAQAPNSKPAKATLDNNVIRKKGTA